jgi:flavin reductase (DIM6/NTAB) family NADH-FMN oxidoreductase RutF
MNQAASQARAPAIQQERPHEPSNERGVPVSVTEFRGAMSKFTTAVSVIATGGPAGTAGLTCSAVCAVSDTPATLAVCIHAKSGANSVLKANGVLSVNCLQTDQMELSQAFAGIGSIPMAERFAMANWGVLVTGAPYCKDALVALDCEIADVREVGTHSVFIVKVVATVESEDRAPLIYQQRNYATTRRL